MLAAARNRICGVSIRRGTSPVPHHHRQCPTLTNAEICLREAPHKPALWGRPAWCQGLNLNWLSRTTRSSDWVMFFIWYSNSPARSGNLLTTTYAPSGTFRATERAGNNSWPILNLCMTPPRAVGVAERGRTSGLAPAPHDTPDDKWSSAVETKLRRGAKETLGPPNMVNQPAGSCCAGFRRHLSNPRFCRPTRGSHAFARRLASGPTF